MERLRHFLRRVLVLPLWLAPLVAAPCFVLLGICLSRGDTGPLAHAAYLLSIYALVVIIVAGVRLWKRIARRVRHSPLFHLVRSNPLVRRFREDVVLRTKLTLGLSMGWNLSVASVKLIAGIAYRSVWLITLGTYYLVLAYLRFFILRSDRKSPIGEDRDADLRRYRLCGVVLLLINLLLLGVVVQAVLSRGTFNYPGPLIYVMAVYAFYAVTNAVIKLLKFRRYDSPLLSAARAVSLTAAMVSMLSLEIALTARFGADDPGFQRRMIGILGGMICLIELTVANTMIVRGTRLLRENQQPD